MYSNGQSVDIYFLKQLRHSIKKQITKLADQILDVERTNPDSFVIVVGDFNRGNLSHELPKYRQLIKCPTREKNTLDHCYTTLKKAYHAVPTRCIGTL